MVPNSDASNALCCLIDPMLRCYKVRFDSLAGVDLLDVCPGRLLQSLSWHFKPDQLMRLSLELSGYMLNTKKHPAMSRVFDVGKL